MLLSLTKIATVTHYLARVNSSNADVCTAEDELKALADELKKMVERKQDILGGKIKRGRARTKTAKTLDGDTSKLDNIMDEIVEAKCKQKDLKLAVKSAKEIASNISDEYDDWKSRFPARTKEELFEHGKSILVPVGTYYKKTIPG